MFDDILSLSITRTYIHTCNSTYVPPEATPILRNTGMDPKGSKASRAPDTSALHAVSPNRDNGPDSQIDRLAC